MRVILLMAAGLLIGYLPVVLANAGFGRPMLQDALARPYVSRVLSGPLDYLDRLSHVGRGVVNLLGGRTFNQGPESWIFPLMITALAAVGAVLLLRSGRWQVPAIAGSGLLLVPFAVAQISNRYLAWIIPIGMVFLAVALVNGIRRFGRMGWLAAALVPLSFVVVMGLIYQRVDRPEITNAPFRDLARFVRASELCGDTLMVYRPEIYLGQSTFQDWIVHYLLTLDGCEHQILTGPADRIAGPGYMLSAWPPPDLPGRQLTPLHRFRLPIIFSHWIEVPYGLFRVE